MVDSVKVRIEERNGVDLEFGEEVELTAENVEFDNSSNGFVADNVQSAIEEVTSAAFPFTCLDAGELRTSRKYGATDSAGGQTLTSTFDLMFNTAYPGSDLTVVTLSPTTGIFTLNSTDTYYVSYDLTLEDASGSQQVILSELQIDTGSGFLPITGSLVNISLLNGSQTASRRVLTVLNDGDKVKLNVSQLSGTNTAETVMDASSFSIESIQDGTEFFNLQLDAGDHDPLNNDTDIFIDAGEL